MTKSSGPRTEPWGTVLQGTFLEPVVSAGPYASLHLATDSHACPSCHPTNSVNALNAFSTQYLSTINNSTTQTLTVCVQPRPLAVNTSLPAFAVLQPRATAVCDQAVSKLLLYCCNGTDKPTDRRPTVHHHHFICPIIQLYAHLHQSRTARSNKNTNSCPQMFNKTATGYLFYHIILLCGNANKCYQESSE